MAGSVEAVIWQPHSPPAGHAGTVSYCSFQMMMMMMMMMLVWP
jgi:hypothetical protein